MRVHVIETGQIVVNAKLFELMGGNNMLAFLRSIGHRGKLRYPIHAYVVEHPDGLIVVDSGLDHRARFPWPIKWYGHFIDLSPIEPSQEIGPQMRARGLLSSDVRWVIPTHLHLDHGGGIGHFPDAEILVHRREFDKGPFGRRVLDQRHLWPSDLEPTTYDLDPEPFHSFPVSKRLAPDITLVPIPGHSVGQVAIAIRTDGPMLLFAGDHCLTQDHFVRDIAADQLDMLGFGRAARETSRRIAAFVREVPTMLIPAHDPTVAERLAERAPVSV